MTVIDPHLDTSQNAAAGPAPEGRELAMLRHDIRGALQGVIGAVGQIEIAALGNEARLQVDRIAAAARTLGALVGTVLGEEPDRSSEGAGPGLETAGFLNYLRRRHVGEARERGLRLLVEAQDDLPRLLRLEPIALARIVDNLVGNAIKFSESGTVRVTVAREADGDIAFRVLDDGPGLAKAALEQLFRYGYHAGGAAMPGEGVGLHIAKSLTDRLGGRIEIGNRREGGVEAVLRFPSGVVVETARPPAPLQSPDLAGLRVLLAEDNPTNQMVASQMLRALKAEVTVCSDGVEALECFERQAIDLVVVDIEMPRLSGLDVIRAIRSRRDARAQVPIVALTAYAMREHRERIAAAGANGLISKPITSVETLGRGLAAHVQLDGRSDADAFAPAPCDGRQDDADPVIDAATFDALCEAIGADTMTELLDKVIADLLGAQKELAAALDTADCKLIRSASHILISVAGAIGATRLQACARVLNAAAHTDAGDRIADGVRRCIAEIDAAVAYARDKRAAR